MSSSLARAALQIFVEQRTLWSKGSEEHAARLRRANAMLHRSEEEICRLWWEDPDAAELRTPGIRAAARAEAELLAGALLSRQESDRLSSVAAAKRRRTELSQARKRICLGYK